MPYADKEIRKFKAAERWAKLSPEEKQRAMDASRARAKERMAQKSDTELSDWKAKDHARQREYRLRPKPPEVEAAKRETNRRYYYERGGKERMQSRYRTLSTDPSTWERKWRFSEYLKTKTSKQLDMYGLGLYSRSLKTMRNPWFVWEIKGRRYQERLLDPLPIWKESN